MGIGDYITLRGRPLAKWFPISAAVMDNFTLDNLGSGVDEGVDLEWLGSDLLLPFYTPFSTVPSFCFWLG